MKSKLSRAEQFALADKIKQMRVLMGFRQCAMAELINVSQSNYSRMERGYESFVGREDTIIKLFETWRESETQRLHEQISFIKNLHP